MNTFIVHFQDDQHHGKTVLCSFARHMSASEAHARLQQCYPIRHPHRLLILYLTPLLPWNW